VDSEISLINYIKILDRKQDDSEYQANLNEQEAQYLANLSDEEMAARDIAVEELARRLHE
jgi:hypothetical protein